MARNIFKSSAKNRNPVKWILARKSLINILNNTGPKVEPCDTYDLVRAVVNCKECELAIALELVEVTISKCSINPSANPNTVYSHSYPWQYYIYCV
jgi:hypothetical protein